MTEAASHRISHRAQSDLWARVATERALATGALAVVAFHVVDDSFLQPQPGTSAVDHLVGGLVPLALLVWVAAAYGRARAGGAAGLQRTAATPLESPR